jgi:hypothetical protein
MQEGQHVPPKFAPNSALPKNHGYVHNWRNEAEAKWRAKNQERHQRAIAAQLGLEYAGSAKKRGLPEDEPQRQSDEAKRISAWAEYYTTMAREEGRSQEERTQAEAWAQYYAEQARQLLLASTRQLGAGSSGAGSSEQHGVKRSKGGKPASAAKLLAAVADGNLQGVRQQIGAGADVDAMDEAGSPALVLAAKLNHPAILKELLAAGPEEVDQADSDGLAALHYACIEGRKKLVELLLGHGADPTLKTKAGDAPITLVHPEQRQIRSLIGDAAGRRFAH